MSDPTNPSSSTAKELQSDNNPIVNDCIKLFSIKDYVLESQVISTLIEFFQVANFIRIFNTQLLLQTSPKKLFTLIILGRWRSESRYRFVVNKLPRPWPYVSSYTFIWDLAVKRYDFFAAILFLDTKFRILSSRYNF